MQGLGATAAVVVLLAAGAAHAQSFTCEPGGSATRCTAAGCFDLGTCLLGCDADAGTCRVPSNIPARPEPANLGSPTLLPAQSPFSLDTDTGELRDTSGAAVRPAGTGLDGTTGIAFERVAQGGGEVGLFWVTDLSVPSGVTINVVGSRPLVIFATGDVVIDGTLDVGARGTAGGPGGFDGGLPGTSGDGPCGGPAAPVGTDACPQLCTAGAGGAGHGGPGGDGGAAELTAYGVTYPPTAGAGVCGAAELVPLVGGSGGAGGALPGAYANSTPGLEPLPPSGGGGGGAIQLSARGSITLGVTGVITAPGEGATAAVSSGGGSGGAGGAILLESPVVTLSPGSVLAANGGGGGGGDCT